MPFDDISWQDSHLQNRRIPVSNNRGGKKGRAFDVKNAFGTYSVKCSTIERQGLDVNVRNLSLDIHNVTEAGDGMIGSFEFGGVMVGMMLFAGSRTRLREIVEEVDAEAEVDEPENDGEGDDDEEDDAEAEADGETNDASTRRSKFEKNTFRTPKFFFALRSKPFSTSDVIPNPGGFMEFSGNECRDFKGTFSSELVGENVAFSGWKLRSRGSPCPHAWEQFG